MNKGISPFDTIYEPKSEKEVIVESRLSILVRHLPVETPKMMEAYFEVEKRTKNIVREVFKEFDITQPKEVSVLF